MKLLNLYNTLAKFPLGKKIFSKLFCLKAPYFGTIHPYFEELRPGHCVVTSKKRWSVQNHIGSFHAIAMCNMAEAAGGLCMEISVAKNQRWIPKGMEVQYLKKAMTSLKAICDFEPASLKLGDNPIEVGVFDTNGEKVFRAVINMYVSEKKAT